MKGSTHRRCYCRDPKSSKPLGKNCPKLTSRKHGSYSIRQELPPREDGTRRSFSRAGYESLKAAQADLDHIRALLGLSDADEPEGLAQIAELLEKVADEKAALPNVEETRRRLSHGLDLTCRLTVGDWLDMWLAGKKGRPSAISRDEGNIRLHLKPRIGHLRLDRLRVSHLSEMFEAIAEANVDITEGNATRRRVIEDLAGIPWKGRAHRARRQVLKAAIAEMDPFRRIVTPATRQRIRSTLRAALNAAIAQQLITFNPAAHVELEAGKRPKALVWTEERILHWKRTGEKPSPVMVWTPEHTGLFLDHVAEDRLYALWHLIVFRGLRRGEACGQRWTDTHLDDGRITVAKQLVVSGWEVYEDDPKTDAGARTIALDSDTVRALKQHRVQQDKDREEWGSAWVETGRVFTKENGELLHPANVTRRFIELYEEIGLPPIRLHDLRHGAATLAHAAGADLKDIQEMLGHSSIAITADTYTSLLPETDRAIAEAAARLVPRARPTKPTPATEVDLEADEEPRTEAEAVADSAGESAAERGSGAPSAHAPRTQTAPDEESEAE
ncbi:tyrosine-type recombinase/integrase [Streptomyces hygroscopicus]|uniref:tyrosine-type recombinase/integrase n=1 Tax=Streptomyces hygroscopicus TaxID=1912 RepID=UPI001FCAA644|nr:tyrosine-type recombinase/integrase [Streptomyces hygroscopicus]BDH15752.1 site-specific integrase [Streptomyces hygroscopicus]